MDRITYALCAAGLVVLLAASPARPAWAVGTKDPEVAKIISQGLEWLAKHQSQLGPLDGQQRPLPDGHDRAGGRRLPGRGLDDHAGQVRRHHPQHGRLSAGQRPPQRPDRRSDPRRPLHLRPRLRHAVPLPGAGRGGGRRSPQATGRRVDQGGDLHRPGPDGARRLGLRQRQGRAGLRRRLDHDHPGARAARLPQRRAFPCPRRSSTRPSSTSAPAPRPTAACSTTPRAAAARPAITAAAIACLFNAGDYDNQFVPKLQDYCRKNLDNISNQGFGHWHYAHYYYAQVRYREGGKSWEEYRDKVYDRLVKEISPEGCWNQGYVGPVFTTAVNLTILQLENANLPIYQR